MSIDQPERWSDHALDAWRLVGDAPADAAVAAYFDRRRDAEAGQLFGLLVRHLDPATADRDPALQAFLDEHSTLPAWADHAAIERGQDWLSDWVLHQFTALYLASLPNAYAAAKGTQVIWLTGRMRDDPRRRLNETAQFLMDVSAPKSFTDGRAVERILHVRLMHAAIRWLVLNDPRIAHPADASPAPLPTGPVWSPSWGVPLNQEDLAGTMLTFTTVVFDAFERSGVAFSSSEAEDYLALWRVVAAMLGIDRELIPDDVAGAVELQRRIFTRQHQRSAVGAALTLVLLDLVRDRLPRLVSRLAAPMLRRYVGDEVADLLDVPAGGARRVLDLLVWLTRVTSRNRAHGPLPAWLSRRIGRALIEGLLDADRHGDRVPFDIPDRLAAAAGIDQP